METSFNGKQSSAPLTGNGNNTLTRGARPAPTTLIGDIGQVFAEVGGRFYAAKLSGDVDGVRGCLTETVWKVHDLLAPVLPNAALLLDAIAPIAFARRRSRHWLVG